MTEREILRAIAADRWMMAILEAARQLNLPDWMIGAGFVRSKVWDVLHGYETRTPLDDIDLIYFDPSDLSVQREKRIEATLTAMLFVNWSAKNQARMHLRNHEDPYTSSEDALAHWPDTPTCVAVTLDVDGHLRLIAPYGVRDLVNLTVRPSPGFHRDLAIYKQRVADKDWSSKWPSLRIL
jgi:hypothetical protein